MLLMPIKGGFDTSEYYTLDEARSVLQSKTNQPLTKIDIVNARKKGRLPGAYIPPGGQQYVYLKSEVDVLPPPHKRVTTPRQKVAVRHAYLTITDAIEWVSARLGYWISEETIHGWQKFGKLPNTDKPNPYTSFYLKEDLDMAGEPNVKVRRPYEGNVRWTPSNPARMERKVRARDDLRQIVTTHLMGRDQLLMLLILGLETGRQVSYRQVEGELTSRGIETPQLSYESVRTLRRKLEQQLRAANANYDRLLETYTHP